MLVSDISTLINWSNDSRNFVTREIFKYDKGNDVTVVIENKEKFNFYNEKGKEEKVDKGTNVDIRA